MRKKISILLLVLFLFISTTFGATSNEKLAVDFLAEKGIIVDNWENYDKYNLDFSITRREMLKVMMNISGKVVKDTCEWRFSDMSEKDWGCKYAEAALNEWYIAWNKIFRPDDGVTKIEALKMIMQAKWIERDEASDWREGYVSKAVTENILDNSFSNYNDLSDRGWIFIAGAKTYNDAPKFGKVEEKSWLTPEEEELIKFFLG